jgi:hypothetical protein
MLALVLFSGFGRGKPLQLAGRTIELPLPTGMCALSEQRHKEQLDFARQLKSRAKQAFALDRPV